MSNSYGITNNWVYASKVISVLGLVATLLALYYGGLCLQKRELETERLNVMEELITGQRRVIELLRLRVSRLEERNLQLRVISRRAIELGETMNQENEDLNNFSWALERENEELHRELERSDQRAPE